MTVEEFLAGDPDRSCWWGWCDRPAVAVVWVWAQGSRRWIRAAVCAEHPFDYVLAA